MASQEDKPAFYGVAFCTGLGLNCIDLYLPRIRSMRKLQLSCAYAQWAVLGVLALQSQAFAGDVAGRSDEDGAWNGFSYGKKGLQFESADGNNFLWFGVRLQTRYSNEKIERDALPGNPIERQTELKFNRGRLKLGGHLVSPRFTVYSEYDFVDSRLLDFRASYSFSNWLNVRVGQWKSPYNRERIDSSGAQQFAERSVATPWFTVDRQQGVVASGRFGEGRSYDSSYWFGWLSGSGRGGSASDGEGLWLGRYQWNFTRRVLAFSQSDIALRDKAAGSLSLALVDGESEYTSFSSAGGGQLPGFENAPQQDYRLQQAMLESAWKKGGFSWQQELHWKRVRGRSSGIEQDILGGYVQAGMFFSQLWPVVPTPLEFALRYAQVDPNRRVHGDYEKELTVAANWFFNGHRNKLTADLSRVVRRATEGRDSINRVRIQWDWSF